MPCEALMKDKANRCLLLFKKTHAFPNRIIGPLTGVGISDTIAPSTGLIEDCTNNKKKGGGQSLSSSFCIHLNALAFVCKWRV